MRATMSVRIPASRRWPLAELIAACVDDLRAFVNGGQSLDDMTVLAVRRCA